MLTEAQAPGRPSAYGPLAQGADADRFGRRSVEAMAPSEAVAALLEFEREQLFALADGVNFRERGAVGALF